MATIFWKFFLFYQPLSFTLTLMAYLDLYSSSIFSTYFYLLSNLELAIWLIGVEDDSIGDGLLTILIENAQENSNILLPTLQFIEVRTKELH